MKNMKLTPWFAENVPPVRVGWYQRDYGVFIAEDKWSGKEWLYDPGFGGLRSCYHQQVPWRGRLK
jgi:hypothetical protein